MDSPTAIALWEHHLQWAERHRLLIQLKMSYHPPNMILQLLDTPNRAFPRRKSDACGGRSRSVSKRSHRQEPSKHKA
ncbi:hypothetical protein [uncultured Nostoc sp.]|uniref:hypothetical protein n=1 Tax=uncultured Nostoc sp. TaxID=340711 RepID=UPI0035CBE5A7